MTSAARLLVAVTVALVVRTAAGQQFPPGGAPRDPYAPRVSQLPQQPPADLRYPLPPQGANPYAPQPAAQPGVNQSLRYPSPPQFSMPAAPPIAPPGPPPLTGPQPASFSPAAPPPQTVLFQRGQIVARVGDKTIFYGDVAPTVNMLIEPALAKEKSPEKRAEIEASREALTRHFVRMAARSKMLLCEFERTIPAKVRENEKEFAKKQADMDKRIRGMFEKMLESYRERLKNATPEQTQTLMEQEPTVARLALLMKDRQLESLGELDQALREYGSSLEAQSREFGEAKLGMEAVYKHITKSPEVTHQEMLDYYQEHIAEYAIEPKARFEILSVKFANYRTKDEAQSAIAAMGNAVYLGGVEFAAVARKHSQEPRASEGGQYDWITQGSLASKAIDQAVFSLEVGKLSQVIEDETGLHIIRVKERQGAGRVSFLEAQEKIKKAIQGQKRGAEHQKFLTELAARTSIWTIYDPPANVASQPAGTMPR